MTESQWVQWAVSASLVLAFLLLAAVTGWTFGETLLFVAVVCFALLILLLALCVVALVLDRYRGRTNPRDKVADE